MEFKLVELAKELMAKGEKQVIYKEQIHSKESPVNQSGMICSGKQEIAIVPLNGENIDAFQSLYLAVHKQQNGTLIIRPEGLFFDSIKEDAEKYNYRFTSSRDWEYRESIGFRNTVHIIGGGHVGTALSRQMALIGFHVIVYDNRDNLNTMNANQYAHEKRLMDYEDIHDFETGSDSDFIVLMTFEYRTDKILLAQLIDKPFRYLGLMGSESKVQKILQELKDEGILTEKLNTVYAPIGLPIFSKTPEEIAVSIAAEIIRVKNEGLPTGRLKFNL